MEIRSNTPSFGMAFVKPAAEAMSEFKKDVYTKRPINMVNKGLAQLVAREKANKNYNVLYQSSGQTGTSSFVVRDVRKFGEEAIVAEFPVSETKYPPKIIKVADEMNEKVSKITNPIAGWYHTIKGCVTLAKEYIKLKCFNQIDFLPDALRKAADTADEMNYRAIRMADRNNRKDSGINNAWSKI